MPSPSNNKLPDSRDPQDLERQVINWTRLLLTVMAAIMLLATSCAGVIDLVLKLF